MLSNPFYVPLGSHFETSNTDLKKLLCENGNIPSNEQNMQFHIPFSSRHILKVQYLIIQRKNGSILDQELSKDVPVDGLRIFTIDQKKWNLFRTFMVSSTLDLSSSVVKHIHNCMHCSINN